MIKRKYNKEFEEFRKQTIQVLKIMDRAFNSIDNELAIDVKRQLTLNRQNRIVKECFHYDKSQRSEQIIKAHSIQRQNRLFLLEEDVNGNKQLCSLNGVRFLPETNLLNKPILGKKVASTFSGFCGFHNKTLFSPIEDHDFDDSEEHKFLHSYRSYAYSYHKLIEEGNSPAESSANMLKNYDVTEANYFKAVNSYENMKCIY
jgi:hypothetical protein